MKERFFMKYTRFFSRFFGSFFIAVLIIVIFVQISLSDPVIRSKLNYAFSLEIKALSENIDTDKQPYINLCLEDASDIELPFYINGTSFAKMKSDAPIEIAYHKMDILEIDCRKITETAYIVINENRRIALEPGFICLTSAFLEKTLEE